MFDLLFAVAVFSVVLGTPLFALLYWLTSIARRGEVLQEKSGTAQDSNQDESRTKTGHQGRPYDITGYPAAAPFSELQDEDTIN